MKLNYLETKDIGVLSGIKRFEFHDQLTIIYGPNFSGKSTLAGALYFALCGKLSLQGMNPKNLLTPGSKTASVGLSFQENGMTTLIEKTIGKKRRKVKMVGESNVGQLPNLEPDQWRIGYFLKEEEIADFLSRTPSSRRDLMYRLLGIERLITIQQQIIKARRIAKREEKGYKQELALLENELFSDHSEEIKAIEKEIILFEEKIRSISEGTPNQGLINELESQKQQLDNTVIDLNERVSNLYEGFSDIDQMASRLDDLEIIINEDEQAEKHLEHLAIEKGKISAKLDQAQKNLNYLRDVSGYHNCPLCKQGLTEETCLNLKDTYSADIGSLEKQLLMLNEDEKIARSKCAGLKKHIDESSTIKIRLSQLKELEEQIKNTKEKNELVKSKLLIYTQDLSSNNNSEIEELNEKLHQSKSKLSDLIKEQILYQRNYEKRQKAEKNYATSIKVRLKTELLAESLNKTLQSIIGTSLETVEESITKCLDTFNVFQDHSGEFELEKSGLLPNIGNRPFQMLSGSEKTIVLIGLKMALSKLMPGANFFIMDNPLLHLDEQRKIYMKEYVSRLSKFKQIILFTNDRDFADQFSECSRYSLI